MPRRRYALILGFLVLLGLGVRVAFVFSYQEILEDRHAQLPPGSDPPLIGDSYFYFWVGRQIADGDGFVRPFELREHDRRVETAERPPLYPLVLAIPSALGARSLVDAGIFSALIGTATIVLIAALGRRVGGDAVGLVAAGIAAVYPTFWQPNGIVLSETLYVPLVAGMLLLAYQILDRPTVARWCGLGVLFGLGALTRGEGLALFFVLGLPLVWATKPSWRARLEPALLLSVATFVVVAPWTIRNLSTFDGFVPVSNNLSTAISGANCDAVYSGRQLGSWEPTCFYEDFDRALAGGEVVDEEPLFSAAGADGREYIRDHLGRVPVVVLARVLRTWGLWNPGPILEYDEIDNGIRGPLIAAHVMYLAMLPLAVAGIVLLRRCSVAVWPLLAPAIVVMAVSAALHGLTRFRAAAEVPIVVLASVAFVAAFRAALVRIRRIS